LADIDGKATNKARTTARLFDVHMNSNNNYASELSSAKGGGVEVGDFIDLTVFHGIIRIHNGVKSALSAYITSTI
jgi:hypothetical protein